MCIFEFARVHSPNKSATSEKRETEKTERRRLPPSQTQIPDHDIVTATPSLRQSETPNTLQTRSISAEEVLFFLRQLFKEGDDIIGNILFCFLLLL